MERSFPPLSPSISPVPEGEPPTTSPNSTDFLVYLFVIHVIVSLTFLLGKFICNKLFLCSEEVHDPDRTPNDTTAPADARQVLESNQVIIDIDDSSTWSSSPETKDGPSELGSCPICLEELLVQGKEARVLPRCRHVYHRTCIDQWLMMGSESCPLCRDRAMQR